MGSSIVHLCIYGIVSVILLCQLTSAVPPHQCQPGLIDELPLKLRKICAALYTLADFTDAGAAQQYLNEKGQPSKSTSNSHTLCQRYKFIKRLCQPKSIE